MKWENKIKLCKFLNNRNYIQAVKLLEEEKKWDTQCIDMFINGFSLNEFELCKPIKDRILEYNAESLGFRESIRLYVLKDLLENGIKEEL